MASRETALLELTPEVLLKAYACGIFPMAEKRRRSGLYWIEPERRGVIPLDSFHVPSRLARTVRTTRFTVVCNRDFDAVIDGCAAPRPTRAHLDQHAHPHALSRTVPTSGTATASKSMTAMALVGGLYGVSLGRAYLRREHVPLARDASKVALVHLVARLKAGGYRCSTPSSSPIT